ncbi:MAG TPA: hypothetical protein VG347_19000 [Verrucomicrobiae bacterium]|nr:hypothetical protein [Verrucomicrobiae bacterium]
MDQPPNNQIFAGARRECLLAGLLLAFFFLINLVVITHTPTVAGDEPGYADPAANLYLGSGFTSTMWGQDSRAFWCGNVPLCQYILYADFKLFGFGLFQARAAGIFLAGGGAFLIWAGLRFSRIIAAPAGRILCLALVLSGAVSTLTFRTIRPDTTMFFFCALVFFFSQLPLRRGRRWLLAGAAGILLPAAGIPMLPYAGLMAMITIACLGWAEAGLFVSVGLGICSGLGLLAIFYNHFSSLKTFVTIVLPFTGLGGGDGGGQGTLRAKFFGVYPGDDNLLTCFFGNPFSFYDPKTICDYSAALLFVLFLVIAIRVWPSAPPLVRRRIIFVVLLTLLVPPAMHVAGHYRSGYRWMTYIPLTIAVPWVLGLESGIARPRMLSCVAMVFIGASLFAGIPARTLIALHSWPARSITPIEQAAAALVHPDDIIICSRSVWFAVRPRARQVYCCNLPARGALPLTVNLPTNNISLLCLFPEHYDDVIRAIGGRWQKIPSAECPVLPALATTIYNVDFYRRQKE